MMRKARNQLTIIQLTFNTQITVVEQVIVLTLLSHCVNQNSIRCHMPQHNLPLVQFTDIK